jgi:hypothetical protein
MIGYIITCTESANILSHDWGTEFYHDKEDAEARTSELEDCCDHKFFVQKVKMLFRRETRQCQ